MPSCLLMSRQHFFESDYRHYTKNFISRYHNKTLFRQFLAQLEIPPKSAPKLILSGTVLRSFKRYVAKIGRHRREKHQKPPRKAGWRRGKMGQESSSPVDESIPPKVLQSRTVEGVAKFIRDGRAKKIVIMVSS